MSGRGNKGEREQGEERREEARDEGIERERGEREPWRQRKEVADPRESLNSKQ